jgi:hypothetical protein
MAETLPSVLPPPKHLCGGLQLGDHLLDAAPDFDADRPDSLDAFAGRVI